MYIQLCACCMNSLHGTAGCYSKFLWDLLSPAHVISHSSFRLTYCTPLPAVIYPSLLSWHMTSMWLYLNLWNATLSWRSNESPFSLSHLVITFLDKNCNNYFYRLKLCRPYLNIFKYIIVPNIKFGVESCSSRMELGVLIPSDIQLCLRGLLHVQTFWSHSRFSIKPKSRAKHPFSLPFIFLE